MRGRCGDRSPGVVLITNDHTGTHCGKTSKAGPPRRLEVKGGVAKAKRATTVVGQEEGIACGVIDHNLKGRDRKSVV